MSYTAPEVGKTYTSRKDPALCVYVENVLAVEADETGPAQFLVEGCRPEDRHDPNRPSYELLDDEWAAFDFTPATV